MGPYLDALHSHATIVLLLALLIWRAYLQASSLRDRIRDQSRGIWKVSNDAPLPMSRSMFRESRFRALQILRKFLDVLDKNFNLSEIFSMATLVGGGVVIFFFLNVGVSRIVFNFRAGMGKVCVAKRTELRWLGTDGALPIIAEGFPIDRSCWASGMAVEKGVAYRIRIDIVEPWFDRDIMADVGEFESDNLLRKFFKRPLLRWPSAGWFQPIARIGDTGDVEWPLAANDGSGPIAPDNRSCMRRPMSYLDSLEFCEGLRRDACDEKRARFSSEIEFPLAGWWIFGSTSQLPPDEAETKAWLANEEDWRGGATGQKCLSSYPRKTLVSDFVAQRTGELFLFVNDAIPLFPFEWDKDTHYHNNRGSARVTLSRPPLDPAAFHARE